MGHAQDVLQSLGPIAWSDVPQDGLQTFLEHHVAEAHTIIDSVPSPTSAASQKLKSAGAHPTLGRSNTDSALPRELVRTQWPTPDDVERSRQLRSEWKDVKVNQRENPHCIQVHKLSSKDGRGAWFARRSIHEGLTFDQWRDGMQTEFLESMKVQEGPGSGAIRGIGADRRVEHHAVPGVGLAEVFQLSAQFPGPTAPRDFITLLLTSEFSIAGPHYHRPLRQYIVVSKPCDHPDCPPRQGIIRGQYESVELIREVPSVSLAEQRSRSSTDVRAAAHSERSASPMSTASATAAGEGGVPTAIEWIMVTRSDPGGSVPRFMIERGTPPGIINDAGKFVNWLNSRQGGDKKSADHSSKQASSQTAQNTTSQVNGVQATTTDKTTQQQPPSLPGGYNEKQLADVNQEEGGGMGVWGMITGAFGAAGSVMSNGLRWQLSSVEGMVDSDSDTESAREDQPAVEKEDALSDTSSIHSFASALDGSGDAKSNMASTSDEKSDAKITQGSNNQDRGLKELKRLEERRRKLDAKMAKLEESVESKRVAGMEKEAASLAKSREKHEKEMAKHEAKYKKELRRIEEKREQAERKAEKRKKKTAERQEKTNLMLELDKTRAERDVALKKVDLLSIQIGQLQAENTKLVAERGRLNTRGGDNGAERADAKDVN